MSRRILACTLLLAALGFALQAAQNSSSYATAIKETVDIRMRDGIALRADVWRPQGSGRFPVLVYRTPYGRISAETEYTTFAHAVERGFSVVIQDVRGRYDSQGEFRPYENEGRDGYDTIEWAAEQAWSDGSVGTFGLSYPGAVQWLAAVNNPPHLKAMVPAMTFSTPQNFFYAYGTWDLSWIEWIWNNIAPDVRRKKNLPGPKNNKEAYAAWKEQGRKMMSEVPLNSLTELRDVAPYYYDWLSHAPEDHWWDWAELRGKYGKVHAAVLNLSAWYDDNYGPEGATTNYSGLLESRLGNTDKRTQLLLGPWVHGVDSTEQPKAGDRKFAGNAVINYDEVVLRWMDHYLRGVDNGVEREPPVRYYVMGRDEWQTSQTWPPAAKPTPYYFHANAEKSTAGQLSVQRPGKSGRSVTFVSDAQHPVENRFASSGAHDYRELAKRNDVLTFDSEPLQVDTEITGPIRAEIFMSCDCRDADLWVRLADVAPDGTAFNLMSPGIDVQRASYRDLDRGPRLLKPGKAYLIALNHLITSNVFKKGHRIRAQVSGSFFPNFSRNTQIGKSERTSGTLQTAHITIHTDREHASRILLPVIER